MNARPAAPETTTLPTHRVLVGDCIRVMRRMPTGMVDALVCDPPYGIAYTPLRTKNRRDHPWRSIRGDATFDKAFYEQWLAEAYRLLKPDGHAYVFAHERYIGEVRRLLDSAGFTSKRTLIWDKGSFPPIGDNRCDWGNQVEYVQYAIKGRRPLQKPRHGNVLRVPRVPAARMQHPTEKPVDLLRLLIRKSVPPGGVVLDPFAGSGSTGTAAQLEHRSSVLIELDPSYAAIAKRRLATPAREEDLARAG
jgi:site-specific DNA-methyltransferase (adenine-specific)